jgi:hypothetical protein
VRQQYEALLPLAPEGRPAAKAEEYELADRQLSERTCLLNGRSAV